MGRITEIRTSGDNDEPIHPVRYEMHYLYCDNCGSFDIKHWTEPPNYQDLEGRVKQMGRIAGVLTAVMFFSSIFVFWSAIPFIMIMSVVLITLLLLRARIKSKIKEKGVHCGHCNTQYEYGTPFFSSEENSKGFTMKDVPLPLNTNYTMVGSMLGRVDKES